MAKAVSKSVPAPAPAPTGARVGFNKQSQAAAQQWEDKPSAASMLPLVSVVPNQADMDEIKELLVNGMALQKDSKTIENSLAGVKLRLKELMGKHNLEDGVRYGNYAFHMTYQNRQTLDKGLLIDNGVTAEQIEKSLKPSVVVMTKLVDIPL